MDNKTNEIKCEICGRVIHDLKNGCPYCSSDNSESSEELYEVKDNKVNSLASLIKILGWITAIVFIIAFLASTDLSNFFVVILIIVAILLGCLLPFYASAEVIQILHDIRYKLYFSKK